MSKPTLEAEYKRLLNENATLRKENERLMEVVAILEDRVTLSEVDSDDQEQYRKPTGYDPENPVY